MLFKMILSSIRAAIAAAVAKSVGGAVEAGVAKGLQDGFAKSFDGLVLPEHIDQQLQAAIAGVPSLASADEHAEQVLLADDEPAVEPTPKKRTARAATKKK